MLKKILVPKDRIPIIIGRQGSVKRYIEKRTHTKITVEDDIQIEGEAVDVLTAENIITAIGRGFSPDSAMGLLEEENTLVIMELPRDEKSLKRIRSRLIGTNGKTRRNIEEYTKTHISVYGKTAAIIGPYECVEFAKEALEKLIKGFTHKTVYKFLEGQKRRMTLQTIE
ncbi:MAG: RNA-processing protein [Candidatus Aenigmarchaeota archaeon]|nr:RNA-processing protein [Candidatus Aenigmarchaeota archaeon]